MNISNRLKVFAVSAFVTLAFVSCTKEETSISIEDLPGRAVVKGTVYYSEKQEYVPATSQKEAHIENVYTPVANKRVFLRISNASIIDDQEGYTTFETQTDEEGNYEFEIPVPDEAITVELQAEAFEGSREFIDGWVTSTRPNIQKKEGVFSCAWKGVWVGANDIEFTNIEYGFDARVLTENTEVYMPIPTTLTVRVGLADYRNSYYDDVYTPYFKATSNITVEIYDYDGELIQTGRTDRNGEAKFDILPDGSDYRKYIRIKTSSSATSFDYLDNYGDFETIEGAFDQIGSWDYYSPTFGMKTTSIYFNGEDQTVSTAMLFKPLSFSSVGGNSSSYYSKWTNAYSEWMSY